MQPTAIEPMSVASLRPYDRNARTHSKKQIKQIARSIERFGFTNPVLISEGNEIIAGPRQGRSRKGPRSEDRAHAPPVPP